MFDTLKALGDQLIAQTAPTPPSVMQAIFSLLAICWAECIDGGCYA